MTRNWLIGGLAGTLALASVAFVQGGGGAEGEEVEAFQPIAFPHNKHAGSGEGEANMECMFCHYSAERSVDAGIPSVATCWGCHQVVTGTEHPEEVAKIQEYVQAAEPIPWARIYKISDHAHFPHMRHINAGLECQQCHGEVQEMGVLTERSPVWGGANMGWCIECHRQPNEQGVQQASTDCAVCHY